MNLTGNLQDVSEKFPKLFLSKVFGKSFGNYCNSCNFMRNLGEIFLLHLADYLGYFYRNFS